MEQRVQLIDLFAGPGGLDVAARRLQLDAHGIEWDDAACETRRAEGLATTQIDVRQRSPKDFPSATVLAGGPPCQTYTVAGSGSGRRALDEVLEFAKRMAAHEDVTADLSKLKDERTGLVLEPLRWALAAIRSGKPYQAIVLEQVPAVLPVWEAVGEALEREGYKAVCGVLHAEAYGVPQTRRRAILIARLAGEAVLPVETHRRYRKGVDRSEGDATKRPWVAMGDVLNRPEPFVVVSNYGTGGNPKDRGERKSSEPAATVTGKISRNRVMSLDRRREFPRFSNNEAGLLQTFPDGFDWKGKDIPQQIGNAIPPLLAEHVLRAALGLPSKEAHVPSRQPGDGAS